MQVTESFLQLLSVFSVVFTAPTFQTFTEIASGWLISVRHRYVTEAIFSGGNVGNGHWSRYHRFFSHAAWDIDRFSMMLAKLVVTLLAPGATMLWAIDDTLCRKRGLKLFGAGMHHDPLLSSKRHKVTNWGHDWVVLCVVLVSPFWARDKVFALPIAARLYRNRQGVTKGKKKATSQQSSAHHRTRPELALELIQMAQRWFPNDEIVLTGDSLYGGQSVLSKLPENVHLISHVHPKGVLYELPPEPTPGRKGRRRKKGERLPGLKDWARDRTRWQHLDFDQFGLHAQLKVKVRERALYYTAGKDRPLKVVLTRDTKGDRPDHLFYCTKLDWDARQILSAYATRWAIECTFEHCKQLLGFEDPANRVPLAVQRTAPMALYLYSLAIVWFHRTGHAEVQFPYRPWYRHKTQPSFADILTTLRRMSVEEKTGTALWRHTKLQSIFAQITELLCRAG
ncbi:MAG: transposase [Hyphomicrobiaceae bacterium]|nr:transposase [Hyphomicrobiaceae bacterium]